MNISYFGSDYHLFQDKVSDYRKNINPEIKTAKDNAEFIADNWIARDTDVIYLTGDIVVKEEALHFLKKLPGRKKLIGGNHDFERFSCSPWLISETFDEVYGFMKFKEFWLSHCPVHPAHLRNKTNLHGHDHKGLDIGPNYINLNVDVMFPKRQKIMLSLDEIRAINHRGEKY